MVNHSVDHCDSYKLMQPENVSVTEASAQMAFCADMRNLQINKQTNTHMPHNDFKLDFRTNRDKYIFPLCEVVRRRTYRFCKRGNYFTRTEYFYNWKPEFAEWVERVGPMRAAKMLNEVD